MKSLMEQLSENPLQVALVENEELKEQLEKAKSLFAQFYQVLGAHDANENALDAALAASDGNFDFELCPYVAEVDVDDLQEQLAKANERVKERHKELVSRYTTITELQQANNEYAMIIANLVRRADVKTDLLQNPTFEKASVQINKFAIENQVKGVERLNNFLLNEYDFKGDYSFGAVGLAVATFEKKLRKEQE